MGEFSDWGGMGLPGDTSSADTASADTAPAGAGGDPYGDAGLDYSGDYGGGAEAASQGALPGGADGQYSPYSPNGGVDATDLFGGGASTLANALQLGPGGSILNWQGSGPAGNLGTTPAVGKKVLADASSVGAIVRSVRQATGLRVTAKSIVGLIVRYGFPAAARLTGLAAQQLLALFMREKGVRHHRRGPGIYTIARKLRAASRLQQTVARVLGRGQHHHRRARHRRPPFHTMRRRKR